MHGKRVCFPYFVFAFLMETLLYSWVRKEHSFVRTITSLLHPFRTADVLAQLNYY